MNFSLLEKETADIKEKLVKFPNEKKNKVVKFEIISAWKK